MTYAELSPNEREILRIIHESPNPEKTREMLMDIFARSAAGESMDSIAESYGVELRKSEGRRKNGTV